MNKIKTEETTYLPRKILKENVPFFLILFFITLALYGNILNGQFLNADDIPGIVNNPAIKDFKTSVESLEVEKAYPAILFKLFGMNHVAFHIVSLVLHFINTTLVYIFILILFGKTEAIITTLIFLTHPINSEAVSWISSYGYLIYGFFTLLVLTNYVLWKRTGNQKYLVASLVIFVASIIFYRKPWVGLIPVYVAILDQLVLEGKMNLESIKKNLRSYVWFAIPTIIYLLIWVREQLAFRTLALITLYYNDPATATPYFNRVLYTTFMTIKLLFVPMGLTIYHEGEPAKSATHFAIMSGFYTAALIVLVAFLFFTKSKNESVATLKRQIGAFIVLIFSTMLLSYYIEVLVWAMAERYLYIGSIFFGLIIALVYKRIKYKELAKIILVILLLFYSVRTVVRTNDWKTSKSLWIATQKVSPYSYRVYNNLGDVYAAEANYPEAVKNFQISIQLSPGFADAVHNLGYTYYQMGDLEKSKYYLIKSYEINPRLYQALYKLGVIAYQEGDVKTAREYFVEASRIEPNYPPTINAISILDSLPVPVQTSPSVE